MAGEVVDHCQGVAVQTVDAQDADLRIDRPQACDLILRRTWIRVAYGPALAVLEAKGAVDHDAVFVSNANSHGDRHQGRLRSPDRVEGALNLLVVADNVAARRLYARLGYDEMSRIVAMGKEL